MNVYINDMTAFLPNAPVSNDAIEDVLGRIDGYPSRLKRTVLKNNGIKNRYYAIDPDTGGMTHTNAQLAAEAVKRLKPFDDYATDIIQCLCCGTTSPDLLLPGHGLMVQGELGLPPCEVITGAGICLSGMIAFKYAYMNIATGMSENAVCVGSELSSSFMRSSFFSTVPKEGADVEKRPLLAFDTDFLRWMLSDGAGAAFLSATPNPDRLSLRVDWMDYTAYAGEYDTCMYAGGIRTEEGHLVGWRHLNGAPGTDRMFPMAVKQDIRQLDRNIVGTMKRTLKTSIAKHGLAADKIDWFLPHYSSLYFKDKFYQGMCDISFEIPYERWFTNLAEKGNTGAAAIYIIMAELFHSGKLKKGDRLLCFIPESGRFSHCFMQLTAV
jgi:3-oxoacyl-[acyl-carrier-protein] synthase III